MGFNQDMFKFISLSNEFRSSQHKLAKAIIKVFTPIVPDIQYKVADEYYEYMSIKFYTNQKRFQYMKGKIAFETLFDEYFPMLSNYIVMESEIYFDKQDEDDIRKLFHKLIGA